MSLGSDMDWNDAVLEGVGSLCWLYESTHIITNLSAEYTVLCIDNDLMLLVTYRQTVTKEH